MTLSDALLAFKLLDAACLDEKSRQLALTACTELTFASMKSVLKRIFGGTTLGTSNRIQVNQGVAFFTEQTPQARGKRNNITLQSGQQRHPLPGTNPLDKFGKRSRYPICQSTFHWAKDCPHRKNVQVRLTEDVNVEECNITLFTKASKSDSEIFLAESLGSLVLVQYVGRNG